MLAFYLDGLLKSRLFRVNSSSIASKFKSQSVKIAANVLCSKPSSGCLRV